MQPAKRLEVLTGEVYRAGATGVELPASHVIVGDCTLSAGSGGTAFIHHHGPPGSSAGPVCFVLFCFNSPAANNTPV
jgi:hypothetical protein